jgi:hypothetical protein
MVARSLGASSRLIFNTLTVGQVPTIWNKTLKPNKSKSSALIGLFCATLVFGAACGDDEHDDPDHAHLMFVSAPPTSISAGTAVEVSWMVHTEGELHHTEIRACMGHSTDCGLGGADSFDMNYAATMADDMYSASVQIDDAGPWTIAVFAHVGETPHISDVIHATVATP